MKGFLLALALLSTPALAYNEAVHAMITGRAIRDETVLQPPSQADLDAFRVLFWQRAIEHAAFAHRYPDVESFTAWEFKQFLMLDPAARVHGFDRTPDDAVPMPRGKLLQVASRWPDDDERNRHRYLRDPRTHEVVKAADGTPMPYDPATLDFGSLTGTSSQGHAHYALVDGPLSDDSDVLKKEPWRFAVPPTAHAYGVEFVQIYSDLAGLAAQSGLPSARWLQATFAGAAFHHLEDMCNQIHTVQVGIYDFFRDAFVQSKLRDLRTLGGLLGRRHSLEEIGIRLISNHHLLSEDYFAKHLAEVHLEEADQPDPEIANAPDLARAIIERSSREAPEIYRLTYRFSAKTLHDGVSGHEYDGANGDDPDAYVAHTEEARQAIQQFDIIELRGVRRAVTAVRTWEQRFPGAPQDPVPQLLAYHEAAAKRRASYVPAGPKNFGVAWGYPTAAAALVAALGVAVVALVRRRQARMSPESSA
ncbi:MAG TPA: hypothetical protein VFE90_03390 [Myxococcales bacterium]|nr:hypothetical protein [Myxococcales bacterium]